MSKQYSFIIAAFAILLMTACTHTETTYYPDGRTQSVIQYKGKKEHGKSIYYFHSPNTVEIEMEMKNGKRNGEFRRYHVNGLLDTYCVYENDSIEGVEVMYLANGCKSQEFTYLHGKKNGPHKEYYVDGSIKTEGNYKNDLHDGPWTFYDERGVVRGEGAFHDGEGTITYYDSFGHKERTAHYKNNHKDGPETYFTPSGEIYRTVTYKEDRIVSTKTDSALLR